MNIPVKEEDLIFPQHAKEMTCQKDSSVPVQHIWGRAVIKDLKISSGGGSGWKMHARLPSTVSVSAQSRARDFPSLSPLGMEPFILLLQKAPQPFPPDERSPMHTPLPGPCKPPLAPLPQTTISPTTFLANPAAAFPPHSSVPFHLPFLLPNSWATFDFQTLIFQSLLLWWKL